jgi:hypothetical protein
MLVSHSRRDTTGSGGASLKFAATQTRNSILDENAGVGFHTWRRKVDGNLKILLKAEGARGASPLWLLWRKVGGRLRSGHLMVWATWFDPANLIIRMSKIAGGG